MRVSFISFQKKICFNLMRYIQNLSYFKRSENHLHFPEDEFKSKEPLHCFQHFFSTFFELLFQVLIFAFDKL